MNMRLTWPAQYTKFVEEIIHKPKKEKIMKNQASIGSKWSRFLTWSLFFLYPAFIIFMVSIFIF